MPVSQVQLIGNLTNVEMSVNNSGNAFTRASLAVYQGKDANGDDKDSLWFTIKAWGDLAENLAETYQNVMNSGSKSFRAVVTGRMVPEQWNDKDGNKRETSTVYVEDLGVSLKYSRVGSVIKAANPLNAQAFKGAADKAVNQDVPSPAGTAEKSVDHDPTGAEGVPF
jgi:single stranded DNA-binding protein